MNWINGINTAAPVAVCMATLAAMLVGGVTLILVCMDAIDAKLRNTMLTIIAVSVILALAAAFIHGATL